MPRSVPSRMALGLGILLGGAYLTALVGFQLIKRTRLRALERGSNLIATGAGPVEYAALGNGPPVLILPGTFGGYDQALMTGRSLVGEKYTIVAVSRPGYLRTPIAVGRTPAEQADAMVPLLDSLGIKRAAVLAVSGGGPAALELASRHPERVSGLILISALSGPKVQPPGATPAPTIFDRLLGAEFSSWWQMVRYQRTGVAALESPIFGADSRARLSASPELLSQYFQLAWFRYPPSRRQDGYLNDREQFGRFAFDRFGSITAPTLVIHGTADRNVPIEHGDRSAAGIAGAEYFKIEGGDHYSSIARGSEIRTRIADFLDRTAGPN